MKRSKLSINSQWVITCITVVLRDQWRQGIPCDKNHTSKKLLIQRA